MEFKCFDAWDQLPRSGDALFTQSEKDSLFFSRPWFENLTATALTHGQSMLLACVIENESPAKDQVLAILPLIKQDQGNREWFSLGHIYTSLFTLLIVNENQQAIIDCLAKGVSELPFGSLKLGPFAEDDNNINSLQHALESIGIDCANYAQFFNWRHSLQGQSSTEYLAARPSRLRNTIARKQRKLEREHGFDIKIHRGEEIPQAMTDYYTVYQASWKRNERFKQVINGFISRFARLDWARLAILSIDEQPVAAQIWFVVHKKASIFKLAYDKAWKHYSPGSILTRRMMEYVIDIDKVEEIDFLTGNDHYKQDWMSERRRRWNVVCTRAPEAEEKRQTSIIAFLRKGLKKIRA